MIRARPYTEAPSLSLREKASRGDVMFVGSGTSSRSLPKIPFPLAPSLGLRSHPSYRSPARTGHLNFSGLSNEDPLTPAIAGCHASLGAPLRSANELIYIASRSKLRSHALRAGSATLRVVK